MSSTGHKFSITDTKRSPLQKIGVIGGMGPLTTVAFYESIVHLFQDRHNACFNYDYPEMVIHSVPAPDNVADGVDRALLDCMTQSLKLLTRAGVDCIAIPCNSAHVWIDELQSQTDVRILNMVQETANELRARGFTRPLLLGTKSTIDMGVYQRHSDSIDYVIPSSEDQDRLTEIILGICGGDPRGPLTRELHRVGQRYPSADAVILGCTELPLIVQPEAFSVPVLDTLQILARATVREVSSVATRLTTLPS